MDDDRVTFTEWWHPFLLYATFATFYKITVKYFNKISSCIIILYYNRNRRIISKVCRQTANAKEINRDKVWRGTKRNSDKWWLNKILSFNDGQDKNTQNILNAIKKSCADNRTSNTSFFFFNLGAMEMGKVLSEI